MKPETKLKLEYRGIVDTSANVNGSTFVYANVTEGANVTGESLVKHSSVTGSSSRVENGSVVEHSTVERYDES